MAAEVRVMERHEEKEKSETETPLTIEDFTTEESIETVKDPASTCVTLQIPMEIGDVAKQKRKVGSSTKKILLPTSYILDSDGVWNRSFWSEGPKNHLTLKTCVSKFVPRDLKN